MRVLVTGSNGLVGFETAVYFERLGVEVIRHRELDVRERAAMLRLVQDAQPDVVVHCAALPSAELAARHPAEAFDITVRGTMHLLDALRRAAADAVFVHMSSGRVYGDAPNGRALRELDSRWDFVSAADWWGIDETCRVDQCTHAVLGATTLAADVLVQEYGRSVGLRTGVFRLGSVTGPARAGVEQRGLLSSLAEAAVTGGPYRIHGGRGKQVRDILHARDVARAVHAFAEAPRPGEVYNLGGGRDNSCSVIEAIALTRECGGGHVKTEYLDRSRAGEALCYLSDTRKFMSHYPVWRVEVPLPEIVRQLVASWTSRQPYTLPKAG